METVVSLFACLLFLGVALGLLVLVGWISVLTFGAFGVTVPLWGMVGAWFLVGIVINMLRKKDA